MSRYPNVIFCNLNFSGSSAIDPILRDLLPTLGYDLIPVYPHNTEQLREFLGGEKPIYHWTHSPVATYADLMASGYYKVLYLYRDPRDVLVSMVKNYIHNGLAATAGHSEKQALSGILQGGFASQLAEACEWLRQDRAICLPFTFEEMKRDIPGMVRGIFAFLQLPLDEPQFAAAVHRHSFENVTGRQRGEDGATIRTEYIFRKGVSGGWKQHFDAELVAQFKRCCGTYLAELNFEPDDDWAAPAAVVQFALSPCIPETRALADTLRSAIQSADDEACPEFVYVSDLQALWYPERPTILIMGETDLSYSPFVIHGEGEQGVENSSVPPSGIYSVPEVKHEMISDLTGIPADEAGVYTALCRRAIWQTRLESMSVLVVDHQEVVAYPEETMGRILRFLNLTYIEPAVATSMHALPKQKRSTDATSPRSTVSQQPDGLRQAAGQAYAARVESLSASTIDVLHHAQNQVLSGQSESALASLRLVLDHATLTPNEFLCVLCAHAAIMWVRSIFTDTSSYRDISCAVFELFRDLNVCFFARTGIQRALVGVLALPDAAAEAQYFARLGEALFAVEEWTGAENAFRQGLEVDPSSALLHNDLTVLLWQQGQTAQALAHLEVALRLDPLNPDTRQNAAVIAANRRQ
jgi:tetratricopeptide (TPR) repeat protein